MSRIIKSLMLLFLPSMMIFAANVTTKEIIEIVNPKQIKLAEIIEKESKIQDVDVDLMLAIFLRESQFENLSPNASNASGIGQVIPESFKVGLIKSGMSENEYNKVLKNKFKGSINAMRKNEELNIKASIGLVKWLLDYYEGNNGLATLSYNAGIGNTNAMIGNGKNKKDINISKATWNQGIHYVYDVGEKVKVIKKIRDNGLGSLTKNDIDLLKNNLDNDYLAKNNWQESIDYLGKMNLNTEEVIVDNTTVLEKEDGIALHDNTNLFDLNSYILVIVTVLGIGISEFRRIQEKQRIQLMVMKIGYPYSIRSLGIKRTIAYDLR